MLSLPLAALFISLRTFSLPLIVTKSGAKLCSISTPSLLFGRSTTWPAAGMTWYSLPRERLIVFACAGDSTITRFFATDIGASSSVPSLAGFAPIQIAQSYRGYTLPELCKREKLAGMLGDATFEFEFQK